MPPFRVQMAQPGGPLRVDSTVYGSIVNAVGQWNLHCMPPVHGHVAGVIDSRGVLLIAYNYSNEPHPMWHGVRAGWHAAQVIGITDPITLAGWEAMAAAACEEWST